MKTQAENPNGLHRRYIIQKASGEPVDPRAEYFVLRTDKYAGDQRHAAACRKALLTYADEIETFLPQLAAELRAKHGAAGEASDDAQAFRDLRSLVRWPSVTEVYVSPLIKIGAASRWQVELKLNYGNATASFDGDTLHEAIAKAKAAPLPNLNSDQNPNPSDQ